MKATGIVRRIDDLGRVVVPKEIRRTLRIREGDPLEIYTDREGGIILRKYSPIGELSQFSKQYAEALAQNTGYIVSITDRDRAYCYGRFGEKRVDAERDQPSVGQSDEPKRESSGCERGTKIYFDYGGWRRKLYSTGHLSDYRRGRCHRHRYSDDKG